MAIKLSVNQLRDALRSPESGNYDGFSLLKSIAGIVSEDEDADLGRELVLRALDHQDYFQNCGEVLDALARAAGLFPYLNVEGLDLRDSIAYEFHRPLNMPPELVFHREQSKVYQRLLAGDSVVLSAPTSFGKSKIIDAIIATEKFANIAVIVPTLALIDETRRRLSSFSDRYKLITHLSQLPTERNIFVLTAERAVAYKHFPRIDFFVIDEFYKLDPTKKDDTRAVALCQAFYTLRKGGGQFYLLGPNVDKVPPEVEKKYKCYFYPTNYSTVVTEQSRVPDGSDNMERLAELVKTLSDPTLIFCSSPPRVNEVAKMLVERGLGSPTPSLSPCAKWAALTHHPDWTFCKAIVQGIGIHHGRLPRALSQYVVRMFNEDHLRFLVCTSTLIEGVNTKAKNVVVFDNKIANDKIDFFTFNNIKGRSGRMGYHFVGHVYLFHDPPQHSLPFVDFPMLTQPESTPTSLLIQLDEKDLKPDSHERIETYLREDELPLALVRANAGIDPESQVSLAEHIRENAQSLWPLLNWRMNPKGPEFKKACELIWQFLVKSHRLHGVVSASQLNFRTWQLVHNRPAADRIKMSLTGPFAAANADEAVESVLDFDRHWASFDLPRYLMTLSRIQAHVFERMNRRGGDYSGFASQIECLFTNPVVAALDEYGVPIELGLKLLRFIRTSTDLDLALANLSKVDVASIPGLSGFERELLEDAVSAL